MKKWYNHEILVCKNITESFTSFVLCFLNVLFIIQATIVLKKNIKSFSGLWEIFPTITNVICTIPIIAHFYF